MKQILISIKPEHLVNILNGKKTLEIRKYIPKCLPCEVLIYCNKGKKHHYLCKLYDCNNQYRPYYTYEKYTFGYMPSPLNGKVVTKFTLNKVGTIKLPYTKFGCSEWVGCEEARTLQTQSMNEETLLEKSCLEKNEIYGYLNFKNSPDNVGCVWNIDNLEIFDKPKQLSDYGIKRAPQKYCYVKGAKK